MRSVAIDVKFHSYPCLLVDHRHACSHGNDHSSLLSLQCDMAENVIPGLNDEMCTELDILEADNFGKHCSSMESGFKHLAD